MKRCGDVDRVGAWRRILFLCLAFLLAVVFCRAEVPDQNYLVDVWNVDHGLPQGSVMHVAQTPDGYLWIGTFWQGIARFDGVRFVSYTPVTTPELPDQEGWRLLVDSRGTLWIASLQIQLVISPSASDVITWAGVGSDWDLIGSANWYRCRPQSNNATQSLVTVIARRLVRSSAWPRVRCGISRWKTWR